jgi:hypothetical protein
LTKKLLDKNSIPLFKIKTSQNKEVLKIKNIFEK